MEVVGAFDELSKRLREASDQAFTRVKQETGELTVSPEKESIAARNYTTIRLR